MIKELNPVNNTRIRINGESVLTMSHVPGFFLHKSMITFIVAAKAISIKIQPKLVIIIVSIGAVLKPILKYVLSWAPQLLEKNTATKKRCNTTIRILKTVICCTCFLYPSLSILKRIGPKISAPVIIIADSKENNRIVAVTNLNISFFEKQASMKSIAVYSNILCGLISPVIPNVIGAKANTAVHAYANKRLHFGQTIFINLKKTIIPTTRPIILNIIAAVFKLPTMQLSI